MALDTTQLATDLETLINTGYDNTTDAANAWATVYTDYANTGKANGQSPTIPTSTTTTLAAALKSTFDTSTTAITAANQLATAFTAFWGVPPATPIAFGTGAVSAVTGTTDLENALITEFGTNSVDAAAKATAIATLLETFTKTVEVTFPDTSTHNVS